MKTPMPIFGPLLVHVADAALPRKRRREEHHRSGRAERINEIFAVGMRDVLGDLDTNREIEAVVNSEWP